MTMETARQRRYGSRTMSSMATEWLRKPTTASRASHQAFVKNWKSDGFLSLGVAIKGRGDNTQECMFTKFYIFLRDCLPDGLVGDLGHIRGDDVMEYLLCHKGQTAPSRHKATVYATAAFTKLEAWMSKGKSWREARDCELSRSGKKRQGPTAPGLHTPAGKTHPH